MSDDNISTLDWVNSLLTSRDECTVKSLVPYYKHIHDMIYLDKDYTTFDEILRLVEVDDVNTTLLIGLLRLSYMEKSKINEWENFYNKVYTELDKRRVGPDILLDGLQQV